MYRETPFVARIAFRLPQSLYDKLERWANEEDRSLANLIYMLVKQAAIEHESKAVDELEKETNP
jgi:hypothetical protein